MTNSLITELLSGGWTLAELSSVIEDLPDPVIEALHKLLDNEAGTRTITVPATPIEHSMQRDPSYRARPHLMYLSDRLTQAVADVEQGKNRYMTVSMPPRVGKSRLTSIDFPTWLLRKHPDWSIGSISHSDTLAISWTREVRRTFEENPDLGVSIAPDAGAAGLWQTTKRGGMMARSAPGQSIIGHGFKVMIIDDIVRDFATAHSANRRQAIWDWWRLNALSRLEPPFLVIAIGTRWHEDDFIGRILSHEYEGDPAEWEEITFPAIAPDTHSRDALGRGPGEPLLSPLVDETHDEAIARWATIRESVGEYAWAGMYQQEPAPAQGSIFNIDSWRYWTTDPDKVTDDGRVILLPSNILDVASVSDSWDATFKGDEGSDYVVGQRWAALGSRRFLLRQQRGKWSFSETIERMTAPDWAEPRVSRILVERAANGYAILDHLKKTVSGLKPVIPRESKEIRARAVTPIIEAGDVYLPLPSDPGHEWVTDLVGELRDFPHASNDDQVDALTQYLNHARASTGGSVQSPIGRTALTSRTPKRRSITSARIPDRATAHRMP